MTTFEDRLFALIHGLPVADEPEGHLESGPSEPGAFQKFHEQVVFDHAMGKSSSLAAADVPALDKLLAPRDSRDFGQPIMPAPGGDLAKRFSGHDGRKVARVEREHYSTGDVIAEFDEANHVIRTYFEPVA
jgi:hypothetical protein